MTTEKKPAKSAAPRVRLIKFGGASCPPCIVMDKAKTLERLKEEFPELEIVKLDIYNTDGEAPEGSEYAKNDALSDTYDVEALPTLIFEREGHDGTPVEFMRFEGGMAYGALKKAYAEEKEKFEELSTPGKSLPWGEQA